MNIVSHSSFEVVKYKLYGQKKLRIKLATWFFNYQNSRIVGSNDFWIEHIIWHCKGLFKKYNFFPKELCNESSDVSVTSSQSCDFFLKSFLTKACMWVWWVHKVVILQKNLIINSGIQPLIPQRWEWKIKRLILV